MPGFFHMGPAKVNGKLQSLWMCDKCRKVFAFEHNEKLYCPHCKRDGYPMNLDPTPVEKSKRGVGGSRLIIPCGDPTSQIG